MTRLFQPEGGLHLHVQADAIAVISINTPGKGQNTLNEQTLQQADHLLDELQRREGIQGLVFRSEKPGSFIAGADIRMIAACQDASSATVLSRRGQALFDRLAHFPKPVVAAIHGICLGGGTELALACHGRVASDDPTTALGLPEVMLGLLPGAGGSQRLPRLIGIAASLDMMLTGRQIKPKRALRLGLVDDVVPSSILMQAAIALVQRLGQNQPLPRRSHRGIAAFKHWLLEGTPPGRQLLFSQARKQTHLKTLGNYPAPERIIACVQQGMRQSLDRSLELEAQAFGELAASSQSKALVNLYFSSAALKKDPGIADSVSPLPISRIGVLGAGLMGSGISLVSTQNAQLRVRFKDSQEASLNRGMKTIHEQLQAKRQRGSLSHFAAWQAEVRVTPTLDYSGFGQLDMVIEAVFEELTLKQQILQEVELHCPERTLFATNTSSIPVGDIARVARRPEQVVGMHYFSPVEKMPLLEVIRTEQTSAETIATAVAVGKRQGKTVIVVRDRAGFYVNRILAPYINEAGHLLTEGVPVDCIDQTLKQFGFPVGPFQLLDEVGIDVAAKVAPTLQAAFGERMRPTHITQKMLNHQRLGKKNQQGFYLYPVPKSKKSVDSSIYPLLNITPIDPQRVDTQQIIDRCVLAMINEAIRCLEDGVIRSCRDGDVGAIFGIGFPPFRGGPFHSVDQLGAATVAKQLLTLAERFGERFRPADSLLTMAQAGKVFYS